MAVVLFGALVGGSGCPRGGGGGPRPPAAEGWALGANVLGADPLGGVAAVGADADAVIVTDGARARRLGRDGAVGWERPLGADLAAGAVAVAGDLALVAVGGTGGAVGGTGGAVGGTSGAMGSHRRRADPCTSGGAVGGAGGGAVGGTSAVLRQAPGAALGWRSASATAGALDGRRRQHALDPIARGGRGRRRLRSSPAASPARCAWATAR
ncbi:MAG: hypothetical protein HS111_36160 [Kofleriaceae bacterium]|nr:hypothetical protein [Kofleriaceae bacterium]